MPSPKPQTIHLDPDCQQELEMLVRRHTTAHQIVLRARIILLAHHGHNNQQIARQLTLSDQMVRQWRKRWRDFQDLPLAQMSVMERLGDAPRPGAPAKISAQAYCQIMALACQEPKEVGRPISHWTERELADEAIRQNIVPTISVRQMGRFLKRSRSQAPSEPLLAHSRTRSR